ncbi:MAG: phosphoribosyltransferase family protein [Paraclostridium sp.]
MIKLNGVKVDRKYFGDGTLHLDLPKIINITDVVIVEWHYEKDEEMMIWFIAHHLADLGYKCQLIMPYIPHARMDRVKETHQVFTLKWFTKFINSLNFISVEVLDPHSDVSLALIDHVISDNRRLVNFHGKVFDMVEPDIVVFPDLGATKRYPWLTDTGLAEVTYAEKTRDFNTGKIQDLILHDPIPMNAKVLVVDDICSYGGTLVRTTKALMEAGAEHVDICVTHLEDAVLHGELLAQDGLGTIYATDSIFSWNPTGGKVRIIGAEK